MVRLKTLTALRKLDLLDTEATGAGVEQLEKSLPNVSVNR